METSHLELSIPNLSLSFSAHGLALGLCICSHLLLQEEASLMMAEQGTDL